MFVEGKSRKSFFLQTLLFTAFVATVQKIIIIRACEDMILGQLSMGARQMIYAPLSLSIQLILVSNATLCKCADM